MARNLKAVDRCALKQDLTTRLSSLTSSTLTAATLDSVMTSVLDDHAPATRRKVSARCDPWFSTVAEQARTAKRHKRQMERQWKKHRPTVRVMIAVLWICPPQAVGAVSVRRVLSPSLPERVFPVTEPVRCLWASWTPGPGYCGRHKHQDPVTVGVINTRTRLLWALWTQDPVTVGVMDTGPGYCECHGHRTRLLWALWTQDPVTVGIMDIRTRLLWASWTQDPVTVGIMDTGPGYCGHYGHRTRLLWVSWTPGPGYCGRHGHRTWLLWALWTHQDPVTVGIMDTKLQSAAGSSSSVVSHLKANPSDGWTAGHYTVLVEYARGLSGLSGLSVSRGAQRLTAQVSQLAARSMVTRCVWFPMGGKR
ncbi:hypothetical protein ACOMHN_042856 [Nucella lapillus]